MKMKRIVFQVVTLLLIVGLMSCGAMENVSFGEDPAEEIIMDEGTAEPTVTESVTEEAVTTEPTVTETTATKEEPTEGTEGDPEQASMDYIKLTVQGIPIEEYVIVGNLCEPQLLNAFSAKLKKATSHELPKISFEKLEEYSGKYILLEDTHTNFSEYLIKVEDGNMILSADCDTAEDCMDSFFSDLLGYDLDFGKIMGSTEVDITEGKTYTVEKSAIYSKDKLMDTLEAIWEDDGRLIIGQQIDASLSADRAFEIEAERFREECGVDAAMFGFDLGDLTFHSQNSVNKKIKIIHDLVEYMREGGIVTISAHLPNPAPNSLPYYNAYRGELGHEERWDELMTEGTELNEAFMRSLSEMGDYLEIFKINHAPVIFRPLHEMNGNWFWFGIVNTDEAGKQKLLEREYAAKLWKYVYDYLVTERGIDNMIWEYSPALSVRGGTSYNADVMYCYPGDEYCDIVSIDWYPNAYTGHEMLRDAYEDMALTTGKLFSMSEFGPGDTIRTSDDPDPYTTAHLDAFITECMDDGIKMAYLLTWSSWNAGGKTIKMSMYNMGGGKEFFENSDRYLDKSELAALLY